MPTFQDRENIASLVPDGDYVIRVDEVKPGISNGAKTSGCITYELHCVIEGKAPHAGVKIYETLIDHEDLAWKFDVVLKCLGVAIPKGTAFELDWEAAENTGATFVDLKGRRGWVKTFTDDYKGKKRSKIETWHTNKPKVPPVAPPPAAPEGDGF